MTNQLISIFSALGGAALIVIIVPFLHGAFRASGRGLVLFLCSLVLSTPFVFFGFLSYQSRLIVFVCISTPIGLFLKAKGRDASGFFVLLSIVIFFGLMFCVGVAKDGGDPLSGLYMSVFILPLLCLAFHQPSAWIPKLDRINVATTSVFITALTIFVFLPYIIRKGEIGGYFALLFVFLIVGSIIAVLFFGKQHGGKGNLLKIISIQEAVLLITFLTNPFDNKAEAA